MLGLQAATADRVVQLVSILSAALLPEPPQAFVQVLRTISSHDPASMAAAPLSASSRNPL